MQTSSDSPRLSAIVCTHDPEESITETLLGLKHQSLPGDCYEIILVDNASSPAKRNFLQKLCQQHGFIYHTVEQLGLSLARNEGIELSRGEFVYFVDDDAVAPAHLLQLVVETFEQFEQCVVVGGPVHGLWSDYPPHWLSSRYWRMLSLLSYGDEPRYLEYPEIVIGCNMAFRRSAFDGEIAFSDSLGRKGRVLLGGEEREVQKLLMGLNKRTYYHPRIYVFHRVPPRRATAAYVRERAYGAEISRIELEGVDPTIIDVLSSTLELFIATAIYPLHLLKFGFRSANIRIRLALVAVAVRCKYLW